MIPYSRQSINNSDLKSVTKVLKSNFLTQGSKVSEFENKISKYVNSRYAVAVNSATSALHLACLAVGLKKGDWLWTSPNSFVASSNCGLYCNAKVDFIDISLDTYNICVDKLEKKLIIAKKLGRLPKVIIPVHFAGLPCDVKKIRKLSKKYNFKIIEDASHALGAKTRFNKVGDCKFSDITVFSFHPVKMITTAEGGVATTNNKFYADKMSMLRTHGIKHQNLKNKKKNKPWYFEQIYLGLNYRMNDIEAALGISQLKRLNKFIQKRNMISKIYNKKLKDLPLILPLVFKLNFHTFHLYVIRVDTKKTDMTQKKLYKYLIKNKIKANVHYIPIYTHPFYRKLGFKAKNYPNTNKYYNTALSIPVFPDLKKNNQMRIIKLLFKFFHG